MNTYVYRLGNSLYVNLTNKCTNKCSFCIRNGCSGIGGSDLWLDKEPEAEEVIQKIGDPNQYDEIVFCGFGEPMIKIDEIIKISTYIKKQGGRVRIDTNGHANLYHGRDVVPLLKGLVDEISISLNAPNAEGYQRICQSEYGENAFDAMLDFAVKCRDVIPRVVLSVVDVLSEEDINKCMELAEDMGVEFRLRHMGE